MISFRLDPKSGVPPYRQIAEQVRQAIVTGALEPGDQLPTVKSVVAELAVNPNTVFKGYRELEHEGLVEGRPGAGTFVTGRPAGPSTRVLADLHRALDRWIARARREGLDDRDIEAVVRSRLRAGGVEAIA